MSVMTNEEDTLNNLPVDFQYPSYADVTSETATTWGETQTSSPSASAYAEQWIQEKQELVTQIENQALQLERIQLDLEAKISRSKDLEDQLAQALEMAHNRDLKFEEMMDKFEILMDNQLQLQGKTSTAHHQPQSNTILQDLPTTPDCTTTENALVPAPSKHARSPPTKRQNNNASPYRSTTMYALFRQPQGQPNSSKNPPNQKQLTARKLYETSEAQQMETDEDSGRQPPPRAKPGEKME